MLKGFRVAAVDAGIYAHFNKPTRPDLTLIAADVPCTAAGVFTTNYVKAAPVVLDQQHLAANPNSIRAVLVNAGCANAATADEGLQNAKRTTEVVAERIGCMPSEVLVMSTGVIGTHLPIAKMESGIAAAASALGADAWNDAARAIMTTDTKPKLVSVTTQAGYTITGIAKGAGMIAPNMATMLSVVVTDAAIDAETLQMALQSAANESFNRVVVDGDMSTNDTLLLLANGASGITLTGMDLLNFTAELTDVCEQLARMIVADGEGVTKFITLRVNGARTSAEARQIANTIATSPLVKTAFYGGDANWGRILAAAGRAGVEIDPGKLSLWYDDLQLVMNGTPRQYSESRATAIANQAEVTVTLDLGLGDAGAVVWTCDLSHDYVSINGHYRT
jgi:glutamate N-acetyltransferase / amino-acid N-acetyltransferase